LFLTGVSVGYVGPLEQTLRQKRSASEMRGRVLSTSAGMLLLAAPPGIFIAGWLLESVGLQGTLTAITIANLLLAAVVLVSRSVSDADDVSIRPEKSPSRA
jgi:hypothetical protein